MTKITNKPQYGQQIGVVQDGTAYFTDEFNRFLDEVVENSDVIDYERIDWTGSNLTDIETRNHDDLQNIGEVDETDTDTTKNKHISNALAKSYTDHVAASSAHGASGDVVGNTDWATGSVGGVVLIASPVLDANYSAITPTDSTVSVLSPNVSAAPAAYTQTWGAEVETLANEMKGDINTLVSDLNTLVQDVKDLRDELDAGLFRLNTLLAHMRTAKQLAPT